MYSVTDRVFVYLWHIGDSTTSKHHQLDQSTQKYHPQILFLCLLMHFKVKIHRDTAQLLTKSALYTRISSPCHSSLIFVDKIFYLCPSQGRLIKSGRKNLVSYTAPLKTTEPPPRMYNCDRRWVYTWQYFLNPGVQDDTLCLVPI